jgi:hypothetical protein
VELSSDERLPDILSGWLDIIAMSEPLESELAGVTLESDALPQEDFPPGDVRRRPEAPGNLHLGQAAAVPTYGLLQVDNEDPLFNSEFETGGGETLQTPAPSGPQTAPTATAVGVVGIPLQQIPMADVLRFMPAACLEHVYALVDLVKLIM